MALRTAAIESTARAPESNGRGSYIDPSALMRIKNLQLRAKVVVQGFLSGLHKSPYHGFSVEFTEYREYTPGDDLRYLDWKLFARSDRYYLKRFEDETNLRCWLLVDLSRSMGYGTTGYTKADYARTLAATVAYFLSLQRDAVGLITFDKDVREFLPARFRAGHLRRLMLCLERSTNGDSTDLAAPLEQVARLANRRGLVILISDLLNPIETLGPRLGWLRARGHEVLLVRVLDRSELDFNFETESMFQDVESGRELYIDPVTARANYLRRFEEHQQSLTRACSDLGIEFHTLATDVPLERALFDLLNLRGRKARSVSRRRGPSTPGGGVVGGAAK